MVWNRASSSPEERSEITSAGGQIESLVRPVLPTGYGYAVVDPDGKVLFHSSAVRNMNETLRRSPRKCFFTSSA